MKLGIAQIIQGNALALPLPDSSVDLVVTSPPYFGLRSYQDAGEHYDGQIGSEATPAEFLDALLAATREMVRVLKPSGSIFVNLGDKYSGGRSGPQGETGQRADRAQAITYGINVRDIQTDIPNKSLMGIPWRYAIQCIDQLGLILRAEIIWGKLNGLPESVTDRVRRSHENWFHFTKSPRYFSAVDEIRERHNSEPGREGRGALSGQKSLRPVGPNSGAYNALGKLPGSFWDLPDGLSPVRGILDAVAAGGITPEEGERLWTQLSGSYHTLTRQETAGYGLATVTLEGTEKPQQETVAKTGRTASPTNYSSEKSQQDSPSTTSAATSPASTQPTSNPSPGAKTSDAPTQNEQSADTDIHSLTHTLKSLLPDSPTKSAASASEKEFDGTTSVWRVPTQPLIVPPELGIDHFAAFPFEFPRRIIQGWTPNGICTECGQGRRPVTVREVPDLGPRIAERKGQRQGIGPPGNGLNVQPTHLVGYECGCESFAECLGCQGAGLVNGLGGHGLYDCAVCSGQGIVQKPPAPTTPAVCLDPFGGTGTTALVAKALGRTGITIDLSQDYCRLAQWRCNDPRELAAALQVEKPDPVHPDQLDLFSGIE